MKKYVITEEHLQKLDETIRPLQYLSQPIPSGIHRQICEVLSNREEVKEGHKVPLKSDVEPSDEVWKVEPSDEDTEWVPPKP